MLIIQNFCPSCLISKNSIPLVRKKLLFSGYFELILAPAEILKIPIVLPIAVDSCARRAPIFLVNY